VVEITGNAKQRRNKIRRYKLLVANGLSVEFVYSESSNLPLFFNENNKLPVHPFMEYRFFHWLRRKGIPTGLFLRDLYWRFPHFRKYPLYKRLPGFVFYWLDWLLYMSKCNRLFLPSLPLQDYLPTKPVRIEVSALPPGCEDEHDLILALEKATRNTGEGLTLFYVGGVTPPHYDLTPMFQCASRLAGEGFVLCCRRNEWEKTKIKYDGLLSENVRIIHEQGAELARYYRSADVFIIARQPYGYLELAVPFKVFESVAYNLPIVTFEGSEAARVIKEEGFGWVVKDLEEMVALIDRLRDRPELIAEKKVHLREMAVKHSWTNRALTVAAALGAEKAAK
jgi:glycosyltransferase involved in cell wall biosynthesis